MNEMVHAEHEAPTVSDRPPAGAKLSRQEADDLEWFFGVAPSLFWHSTGVPSDLMSPHEIMRAGYEYRRVRDDKITAYPTAEYRNVKGVEPDRTTMRRFGRISSSVLMLSEGSNPNAVKADGKVDEEARQQSRTLGEMHVSVFRTYFGDAGNVWEQLSISGGAFEVAVDHEGKIEKDERGQTVLRPNRTPNAGHRAHGRIGSLYALTRGGKLLLEYSARLSKKKGQPFYDFGDQVRMQLEVRGKLNSDATALLGRASREARALFVSACFAWNRVRAREGAENHGR